VLSGRLEPVLPWKSPPPRLAELPATVQLVRVSVPELWIPHVEQRGTVPPLTLRGGGVEKVLVRYSPEPVDVNIAVLDFALPGGRFAADGFAAGRWAGVPNQPMVGFAEPTVAEVTFDPVPGGVPGTLRALDIVQRTENGEVLGGLRVLTLVTM